MQVVKMNLFNNVLVHIEGSKIALNIGISHAKVFMESHFGMKHFYVIHIIRTTTGNLCLQLKFT